MRQKHVSENPNLKRFVTREAQISFEIAQRAEHRRRNTGYGTHRRKNRRHEAQNKKLRLHKGRNTGDGKQETENTDGKTGGAMRIISLKI